MKFVTLIPFTFWIYILALAFFWYAFGLSGFVIAALAALAILVL